MMTKIFTRNIDLDDEDVYKMFIINKDLDDDIQASAVVYSLINAAAPLFSCSRQQQSAINLNY